MRKNYVICAKKGCERHVDRGRTRPKKYCSAEHAPKGNYEDDENWLYWDVGADEGFVPSIYRRPVQE